MSPTRSWISSWCVLACALGGSSIPVPLRAAMSVAAPASEPKTPSGWLKRARAHWIRGEFQAAGQAYEAALAAMTARKQVADEGAQAVLLAVDAYWSAYEASGERGDLALGLAAAQSWLDRAGPGAQASMTVDVQRVLARLRAVHDPLERAAQAQANGDERVAAQAYEGAVEALQAQERAWVAIARVVHAAAVAHVAVFDADRREAPWSELDTAEAQIADILAKRPETDRSAVAVALEELRLQIEQLRALAEEERAQANAPTPPPPVVEAPPPSPPPPDPMISPVVGYTLLPAGAAALAGGATLLALGIVVSRQAPRTADDLLEEPAYAALPVSERERFDSDLQAYRDASSRYAYATIISGSALLAGGIAMTVVGAVLVRQSRKERRDRARWTMGPLWTRGNRTPTGWMLGTEF